jgi:hypothetical protein
MPDRAGPWNNVADEPWRERVRTWLATLDDVAPGSIDGLYVATAEAMAESRRRIAALHR